MPQSDFPRPGHRREIVWIGCAAFALFAVRISAYPPLHEAGVRLGGLIEPSAYRGWSDPLWSALVEILAWCGARPLAGWVSVLSALCAAAAVALAYSTSRRIPMLRGPGAWRSEGDETRARRLAGWTAAAALFGAPPVWMAATQPAPAALDLLIIAALARGWISAWASHRAGERRMVLALWAAALWEHPVLALAGPLLALGAVLHTARARLPWAGLLRDAGLMLATFAAVGCIVGIRAAWRPEAAWFDLETPAAIAGALRSMLVREFAAAWPDTGWLLVGILYVSPLLLLLRESALPANRIEGAVLLGIALLASGLLLNATAGGPASPWHLTMDRPLLLFPHGALALWGGHGAAFAAYASQCCGRRRFPAAWMALPALLALGPLAHVDASAPAREQRAMGRVLAESVRSAGSRAVWLAGGKLDPALRVHARDARLSPLIVNTALAEHPAYLRQLASRANPEQRRALTEIGLTGLLFAELRRPGLAEALAVFDVPPHWAAILAVRPIAGPGWFAWAAPSTAASTGAADEAWRAWSAAVPAANIWVPADGPFRSGALALAAYLAQLAEARGDANLAARLEVPSPRARPWSLAGSRAAPRVAPDPARAMREWAVAEAHFREGRKEKARAALERIRRAYPPLAVRALERLLLLDFLDQQWEEIERHARALASYAPNHPLLHAMRGHALVRRGRTEDAVRAFRFSLELGETPIAHHALASLFTDARRWAEALPHADRAVELAPGHPAFLATRGTIFSFLGRRSEAIADFEQALRAGGGVAPAIPMNLAALYIAEGRVEEARGLLARVAGGALSEADRAHYEDVRARLETAAR